VRLKPGCVRSLRTQQRALCSMPIFEPRPVFGLVGFLWIDGQSALIVLRSEIKFPGALRGVGIPVFLESLILAQDERWRRA
jgi:hypothetical protein